MQHISPLRYPGGKASLAGFLEDAIDLEGLRGCEYFEPYAGGAGAALKLLHAGVVSKIHINDADPRIFAFWKAVLTQTDRFIETISCVPLNIKSWRAQKAICDNPKGHTPFDVGFAAFFMNRCNRSGVLRGAGPIGGLTQSGKWRLDVRFHRENLAQRILDVAKHRDAISVHHLDAIDFLKTTLPSGAGRKKAFVYLDPPYVDKADRLYMNTYEHEDHKAIAKYLANQKCLRWIMSYDDTQLVRRLYAHLQMSRLPIRYSLQSKRLAQELVIAPKDMAMPAACFALLPDQQSPLGGLHDTHHRHEHARSALRSPKPQTRRVRTHGCLR